MDVSSYFFFSKLKGELLCIPAKRVFIMQNLISSTVKWEFLWCRRNCNNYCNVIQYTLLEWVYILAWYYKAQWSKRTNRLRCIINYNRVNCVWIVNTRTHQHLDTILLSGLMLITNYGPNFQILWLIMSNWCEERKFKLFLFYLASLIFLSGKIFVYFIPFYPLNTSWW